MVFEAKDLIKQAIYRHKPNLFVAFSGGKCSEAVVHMAIKYWPQIPIVFNNTGVEFPETVRFVHMLAKKWKLNLIETRPEEGHGFWDCVKKFGVPGIKVSRELKRKDRPKCCYWLKEKPTRLVIRQHKFKAYMTGIRGEESWNRKNLIRICGQRYLQKREQIWKYHPIGYWDKERLDNYFAKYKLPVNPVYKKWHQVHDRCGCLPCTAYLSWERKLKVSHPKLHALLKSKIEKQNKKWNII